MRLGDLSERYESGNRGSEAVGWDRGGWLSLGRYQIAQKPVTGMRAYLAFCHVEYPAIWEALAPLYKSIPPDRSAMRSAFAVKWIVLARSGALEDSEWAFIKKSHFDRAMERLNPPVRDAVTRSKALQQVMWSTAVQHGTKHGPAIFNANYDARDNKPTFITKIYRDRSRRFGKFSAAVRRAVMNRFASEKRMAIKLANQEGDEIMPEETIFSIMFGWIGDVKSDALEFLKARKQSITLELALIERAIKALEKEGD